MIRRRTPAIRSLESHPNLGEILGVLAQLPHIGDADLPRLASAWRNTVYLADARARALGPDSPLVLEVLAAFEALQSLFVDDVAGEPDYITVDPRVTTIALKAVRDAIAAAYARPALSRGEHAALMRAWREVYPTQAFDEPDLGPSAEQVKTVLSALPLLSQRCHDPRAAGVFDALLRADWTMDDDVRAAARTETWRAAVLTHRRRVWALVRRSGTEALGRYCPDCRRGGLDDDAQRVLGVCLDAACALLVTDAVDENLTDVLTLPLRELVPAPRSSGDS